MRGLVLRDLQAGALGLSSGPCYANGIGVPKNRAEALKWYRKSADQGNWLARTNLGLSNEECGGAPDYLGAVESCRQMAEQGYAPAQCNLGVCYEKGQGDRRDFPEAYKLYKLASDQNHEVAAMNLNGIVTRMTAAEIAEGERRYREFKATH